MTGVNPVATRMRTCHWCGEQFAFQPKSPRQRFCSRSCTAKAPKRKTPEVERFWSHVDRDGPTGEHRADLGPCWIWTACKYPLGYGQFVTTGTRRRVAAHRWSWENENGLIPDGLVLDHLCRETSCVRPDHLEPVTNAVNVQRGKSGDLKPPNARPAQCRNGHPMTDQNSYRRAGRKDSWACRRCQADAQLRSKSRRGER
jgi:hypothetical protein